jgi:sulfotransferase family protein
MVGVIFRGKPRKTERLDFILAGAQKSGTTALHYFLTKHPDITMGDRQEMHFFDNEEIFSGPVDYELLHEHFPPVAPSTIAGECTPIYMYWKPAIERIWKYNPQIKLLIILRNPVDRAFAHWNMQRFKGREPLDFLYAVKEEKNRANKAAPLQSRRYSYVDRGFYAEQLARVFNFFPREQVNIIKFEEFRDNKTETLDAMFRFLGVEPVVSSRDKDRNVVPYEREITTEERRHLYEIFAGDIAKLEKLLGWDCSDWKLQAMKVTPEGTKNREIS